MIHLLPRRGHLQVPLVELVGLERPVRFLRDDVVALEPHDLWPGRALALAVELDAVGGRDLQHGRVVVVVGEEGLAAPLAVGGGADAVVGGADVVLLLLLFPGGLGGLVGDDGVGTVRCTGVFGTVRCCVGGTDVWIGLLSTQASRICC